VREFATAVVRSVPQTCFVAIVRWPWSSHRAKKKKKKKARSPKTAIAGVYSAVLCALLRPRPSSTTEGKGHRKRERAGV
jgi:hypothetical protein